MKPLMQAAGGDGGRAAEGPARATGGRSGLPLLAVAAALVVGVTVLQGILTERWGGRDVTRALRQDAAILEKVFPEQFGDWEFEDKLESDPKELERAGAVGHVARVYRNQKTKSRVQTFVICATPHAASGHTPDRCYPAAGFEIAESEHRQTVTLADGRKAETFTGTFRKQGQTIRVFWTYSVNGDWLAPQIARIELAGADAVYKLYAITDETRTQAAQSVQECVDFLATLLPALDEAVVAARQAGPQAGGDRGEEPREQAAVPPSPSRG